jgi:catabolite repression HPr-like protein
VIEKKITVKLEQGLHIRPAKDFVKVATTFISHISIHKNDEAVNGKSMLGIMSLAIDCEEEVILRVEGPDELEAISSLEKILVEWEG